MKKVIILLLFVILSHQINAQIPKTISYQGVLTDSQSQLVPSGTYTMIFKLYDLKSGGNPIWLESQNVTVVNGLFNVILGSVSAITQPFDKQYYLEIEASFNTNTYKFPDRVQLTSTAYAFKAMTVEQKPALSELPDVSITSPSAGQVLKYDGSKWKPDVDNTSSGGGVGSLNALQGDITLTEGNNVSITKNLPSRTLTINSNITSISPNIIEQGNAQLNQVLKWNGTNWVPSNENSGVSSLKNLSGNIDLTPGQGINLEIGGQTIKITALSISPDSIQQAGAIIGQTLKWSGSKWVPEKDESNPVGSVTAFAGEIVDIPSGWLLADGRKLLSTDYPELYKFIGEKEIYGKRELIGNDIYFYLPDYRGLFLRGVDGNSGRDPARNFRAAMATGGFTGDRIGTTQEDAYPIHNHSIVMENWDGISNNNQPAYARGGIGSKGTETFQSSYEGGGIGNSGKETRPKNAYVYYIIKAK